MNITNSINRGWRIIKISFLFMKAHKKAFYFPVIAAILRISLLCFSVLFLLIQSGISSTQPSFSIVITIMLWLILDRFITFFFRTALSAYIAGIITKQPISVRHALAIVSHRWATILAFGILNTLLQLKFSRRKSNDKPFMATASLLSSLIGFAWRTATFFIIPIMALEQTGIIESIKTSLQTLRKTWGESVTGTFSIGGISFLFGLIYLPLLIFMAALVNVISAFLAILLLFTGAVAYVMASALIVNSVTTVFKTILYVYVTQGVTGPFDKQFLQTSFIGKV